MKILLFLSYLAVVRAGHLCLGGLVTTDEVLAPNVYRPYSLSVDFSTKEVYFCNHSHVFRIDPGTKDVVHIGRPQGSTSVSVDQKTNDVFIGGELGIYKYNKDTNKSELFGASGTNVGLVYSKDVVYFTDAATNAVYTIKDGNVSRLEELKDTTVSYFVITHDDWICFVNASGLFRQKMGTNNAIHYTGTEFMEITGLTIYLNVDVYVSSTQGIYFPERYRPVIKELIPIKDCYGVAFDGENNLLYCDRSSVHTIAPPKPENKCV